MKKVLLVDDEIEMLESFEKILSYYEDFEITSESDSKTALVTLEKEKFDLVITDLKMKDVTGIDILKFVKKKQPSTEVLMISGYGTLEAGVEAMKEGAFDFLEKPFTSKKLFESIDRIFNKQKDIEKTDSADKPKIVEGIIYNSDKMQNVVDLINKVAERKMNVLITGESGTGKELIARAIHNLSKSNLDPFVPVNCGALPEHLFESELFGHERGAFTGAVKTKPGLLEFANNGTFFFDEIGDMSLALQVKLLRMLEEKKIRRVGGQKEIEIDVRIIAATNKNLEQAVAEKKFRKDLFYRLNTIQIEIPPLRERVDDIIPLSLHFMSNLCKRDSIPARRFSEEAENSLKSYSWPGNVRELQNVIERTYFLSSSNVINESEIPISLSKSDSILGDQLLSLNYKDARDQLLQNFEVEYITYYLKKNDGNITRTAEDCGLDRRSIHRLINKYNIIYHE